MKLFQYAVLIYACVVIGSAIALTFGQVLDHDSRMTLIQRSLLAVVMGSVLTSLVATLLARARWPTLQSAVPYRTFVFGPRPETPEARQVWWLARLALVSWAVVILGVIGFGLMIRSA